MSQIIPKLNLNKTPALVENNSLVFAKNIRLDVDNTIHRDYGVIPMSFIKDNINNQYIDYKSIFNRILIDVEKQFQDNYNDDIHTSIYDTLENVINNGTYRIVGIIAASNEFYIFFNGSIKTTVNGVETNTNISHIFSYNEKEDKFSFCDCNWTYSGGVISGTVINNLLGEKIINIGETGISTLVPFKSINLTYSKVTDDETIYTQCPNIPITNLDYGGTFACVIPNGVYQFFVRYKIRDDFYTDWFLASKEIFVGNTESTITSFGTLKYINTNRDSDNSFRLKVEHLIEKNKANYQGFQLGFILSHDDQIVARAWKNFSFDVDNINFDYNTKDIEETEIIELTKFTYAINNVGNITSFKNKLYISNYIESDFNDKSLQTIADNIDIKLDYKKGGNTYDGNPVIESTIGNKTVISGLVINETNKLFVGQNGIFEDICTHSVATGSINFETAIDKVLVNEDDIVCQTPTLYGIGISNNIENLKDAKQYLANQYRNSSFEGIGYNEKTTYNVTFPSDNVTGIRINGVDIDSTDYKQAILNAIYIPNRYLNDNAQWVDTNLSINNKIVIEVIRTAEVLKTYEWESLGGGITPNPDISDDSLTPPIGPGYGNEESSGVTQTTLNPEYSQTITITFNAWSSKLDIYTGNLLTSTSTLIPYQKYNFYLHFVKESGEITNGFLCSKAKEIEAPYREQCSAAIYPIFKNIVIPDGYAACFFSIINSKNKVATVFNIKDDTTGLLKEGSCFDVNMMLIPSNKDIHIKQGSKIGSSTNPGNPDIVDPINPTSYNAPQATNDSDAPISPRIPIETYTGQYYYSSDSSLARYFGSDGIITFDKGEFVDDKLAYLITDYSIAENDDLELIKCTPYLNHTNIEEENGTYIYRNVDAMNLLGFICSISPLVRERCCQYYSDGSSVYYKKWGADKDAVTANLYLEELDKYTDSNDKKKLRDFKLLPSDKNELVYSNYNLNFVALSEEPKMSIKTYYNRTSNSTGSATESQENSGDSILLRLLTSQTMSDAYTLPAMYKTYTRKLFFTYTKNQTTKFENTIRSSTLYGDENSMNVLEFDANDYYNIPTNRGKIVNLISVGDAILVHTEDSMFKFSGSNTLQSSDGEIQPTENNVFETGVAEIFGSDFGFAGLQFKTDSIVTENGYIFFDRDSRIIYMYSGNGQIEKISDSIEKLFRHRDIYNLYFANDYYNNRFFVSIIFYEDYKEGTTIKRRLYPVTLSFNLGKEIKSFISTHDFYFYKAFNTKTKCYFLNTDNTNISTINKELTGVYDELRVKTDITYPSKSQLTMLKVKVGDTIENKTIYRYSSIIDVIVNTNFEVIKTLNAVNWCSNNISSEFVKINNDDVNTLKMAEDFNRELPCNAMRIYSDTCCTPLNIFFDKSNNFTITTQNNYKLPRFNQGYWTFNYFRNIQNANGNVNPYVSDDNSLIEGKYFVIRFLFDSKFKLETLMLNFNYKQ